MATIRRYAVFSGTIRRLVELLRPARMAASIRASAALALEHWRTFTGATAAATFGGVAIEQRRESAPAASATTQAAIAAERRREFSPAAARSVFAALASIRRREHAQASRTRATGSAVLARQTEVLMAGGAAGERETMSDGTPVLAFQT